ncbi:MAG TPA: winged helix-turn-helix domain-containing protein, partial [Desulfopila sp.]|nr:winged helix-turn-helix domain-containing protein [Desulfopila sp.]
MDFQKKKRTVAFGEYIFDQDNGELFSEDNRQVLMPKDASVLCCLLKQPLRIVPKEQIFCDVWSDAIVSEGVLKACIRRIRQALGDDFRNPTYIETVKGRGYRLLCEVVEEENTFSGSQDAQQTEAPRAVTTVEPDTSHPFVGRTAELHLMEEMFQLSLAGAAQTLFLSGTAGMGKTALAGRFVDSVRSHGTCLILRGACMEIAEMGEAYLPILMALYELKNHLPQ